MATSKRMRRRSKLTLVLAALTAAAIGGTYALVASEGLQSSAASAGVDTTQQASTPGRESSQSQRLAPAMPHARSRAS